MRVYVCVCVCGWVHVCIKFINPNAFKWPDTPRGGHKRLRYAVIYGLTVCMNTPIRDVQYSKHALNTT